jgi:hypothetical protein
MRTLKQIINQLNMMGKVCKPILCIIQNLLSLVICIKYLPMNGGIGTVEYFFKQLRKNRLD